MTTKSIDWLELHLLDRAEKNLRRLCEYEIKLEIEKEDEIRRNHAFWREVFDKQAKAMLETNTRPA